MEASRKEVLAAAGINLEEVLERLMGSETLLERLLGKFAADGTYRRLEEAMAARDLEEAIAASHTLKGMCGNLGMGELFSLFTRQVEALRQGDWPAACQRMEEIAPAYGEMIRAIGGPGNGGR